MPTVDETKKSIIRGTLRFFKSAAEDLAPALLGSMLAHKVIKTSNGEEKRIVTGINPRVKRAFLPGLMLSEAEEARFNCLWDKLEEVHKDSLRPRLVRLDNSQYKDFMISILEIMGGIENVTPEVPRSTDHALKTLVLLAEITDDAVWYRECTEIRKLFKRSRSYINLSNLEIRRRLIRRRLGIGRLNQVPHAALPPGPGERLFQDAVAPRGNWFTRLMLP